MAKGKKTGEVKIYGDIYSFGYNSAASFIERFEDARKGADEINVHLHTDGGDVIEGTLIYNHIKSCDIPVNVYIDGVCCSMGTVVMMAAKQVYKLLSDGTCTAGRLLRYGFGYGKSGKRVARNGEELQKNICCKNR